MISRWRVELDSVWDVLGPFPIHAREHHFLSPAYPLDLSLPISTATRYPTSLTHSATASWSQTTADAHGVIHVAHPSVPWEQIRAAEGWAALQHLNLLRGWLSVCPPSDTLGRDAPEPLLQTELLQAAFYTVLPPPDSPERKTHVPEWHYGNIYALERAPVQLARLPVPPARKEGSTRYEVIICAPYEIRLFGDPSGYSSPHPILTLTFSASLHFPCSLSPLLETDSIHLPVEDAPLQHILAHSITPFIVDGTPFGDAIGVGVQCLDFESWPEEGQGCWSVVRARLGPTSSSLPTSLSVNLLGDASFRIAPTQTRTVPIQLRISAHERIPEDAKQLEIELTFLRSISSSEAGQTPSLMHGNAPIMNQRAFVLRVTLPLTHVPLWTKEKHVPIQASYFFAGSMPTIFSVKPPKEAFGDPRGISGQHGRCRGDEPILALHGAGVDILSQSFWPDSLLRQKYAWVVMPQGRTAWGLDWHGPSATDAFAAVSALSRILSASSSGEWAKWSFDANTRVILMGHSNGGQGAWYVASRWPDRVCAVVPAAGYIKSQAYVSWSMSRFAHFVDPALRAVLDSSLTPDDNDLFLGNLAGKPVLALHGGSDGNVPPWHTREQVAILKTWDPDADVTYHEDPGQPHWYPKVLFNDHVQAFLDRVYFSSSSSPSAGETFTSKERKTTNFTLTVAVPAESGSLNGWQIHGLTTPGLWASSLYTHQPTGFVDGGISRLGQLRVTATSDGHVSVRTTNVAVFSLDIGVWTDDIQQFEMMIVIDGDKVQVSIHDANNTILFANTGDRSKSPWKILPRYHRDHLRTPPQRLQSILSTQATLTLLVPSLSPSPEFSAALRIAHALQLFHALDAQIVSVPEVEVMRTPIGVRDGNMVVIGCAETPLIQRWLEHTGGIWSYADGTWRLRATRFDRPSSAILFSHPHPYDARSVALFLQSTDSSGLERAVRLFPMRTGVLSPDWLVVDGRADVTGAAGVQGAGVYGWIAPDAHDARATGKWVWNERMSWLD